MEAEECQRESPVYDPELGKVLASWHGVQCVGRNYKERAFVEPLM